MPFFKKAKLRVNEEIQVLMPNATTMIIVSNLHKMHLTLGDDGRWVKASTTPPPPLIPLVVGKGSITHPSIGPPDMTISQSHAFLLKEMLNLQLHLTNKLIAQFDRINTISSDTLAFQVDIERDFSSFHDRFQVIKANVQEIIDTLKMREEANEFEMVACQALANPPPQ